MATKDTSDEPQLKPDKAVVHVKINVAFVLQPQDSLTYPQRYLDNNIILQSMTSAVCFAAKLQLSTLPSSIRVAHWSSLITGISRVVCNRCLLLLERCLCARAREVIAQTCKM